MSYNAQNSKPRKGFGLTDNWGCPHCDNTFRFPKKPYSMICSKCGEYNKAEDLVYLQKD